MKKSILVFLMGLFFVSGVKAQVSVAEPEFAEQTLLLTSDSKGTLKPRQGQAFTLLELVRLSRA